MRSLFDLQVAAARLDRAEAKQIANELVDALMRWRGQIARSRAGYGRMSVTDCDTYAVVILALLFADA